MQDGVLQLSAGLLAGLSAWAGRTSAKPEERQLAALLLEDFGSCGPAPAMPGAGAGDVSVNCSSEPELMVVTDRTLVSIPRCLLQLQPCQVETRMHANPTSSGAAGPSDDGSVRASQHLKHTCQ